MFDGVAVGVFNKGDDGAAGIHRPHFLSDLATSLPDDICSPVYIIHLYGDMAVAIVYVVMIAEDLINSSKANRMGTTAYSFKALPQARQR